MRPFKANARNRPCFQLWVTQRYAKMPATSSQVGGIGQSITRWLVGQGAKNIIFTSRSGLDGQGVRDLVHELEDLGARIAVLKCDVSNRGQVERLAEECSATMPPIKGLIHGSAVFR